MTDPDHVPLNERKSRSDMTPDELYKEKLYQEMYFRDLVSHLPNETPPERVSIWQRVKQIPGRTIDICVRWFLVVVLVSIIVKVFIALLGV